MLLVKANFSLFSCSVFLVLEINLWKLKTETETLAPPSLSKYPMKNITQPSRQIVKQRQISYLIYLSFEVCIFAPPFSPGQTTPPPIGVADNSDQVNRGDQDQTHRQAGCSSRGCCRLRRKRRRGGGKDCVC